MELAGECVALGRPCETFVVVDVEVECDDGDEVPPRTAVNKLRLLLLLFTVAVVATKDDDDVDDDDDDDIVDDDVVVVVAAAAVIDIAFLRDDHKQQTLFVLPLVRKTETGFRLNYKRLQFQRIRLGSGKREEIR